MAEIKQANETTATVIAVIVVILMIIGLYVSIDHYIVNPAAEWAQETSTNLQQYKKDKISECQSTVKKSAFREGFCKSLMEK